MRFEMNTAKQYTGCMLSFLSFNRNIEICVGFSFLDYLFSDKEADSKKKFTNQIPHYIMLLFIFVHSQVTISISFQA